MPFPQSSFLRLLRIFAANNPITNLAAKRRKMRKSDPGICYLTPRIRPPSTVAKLGVLLARSTPARVRSPGFSRIHSGDVAGVADPGPASARPATTPRLSGLQRQDQFPIGEF